MTTPKGLVLAAALFSCAGTAMAQDAAEVQIVTQAGKPVIVRRHVDLAPGCDAAMPQIAITQPPMHGTAEVKPNRFVLSEAFLGARTKECGGREVDGAAIWYTPAAGYHGADAIAWTTTYRGGHRSATGTHTAHITVQ